MDNLTDVLDAAEINMDDIKLTPRAIELYGKDLALLLTNLARDIAEATDENL